MLIYADLAGGKEAEAAGDDEKNCFSILSNVMSTTCSTYPLSVSYLHFCFHDTASVSTGTVAYRLIKEIWEGRYDTESNGRWGPPLESWVGRIDQSFRYLFDGRVDRKRR